MTDFETLLGALDKRTVDYIVVGGAAALAHGSARFTQDLDVVYSRSQENLDRLVAALRGFNPCLRGAPSGLPLYLGPGHPGSRPEFHLETSAGFIDLLGEIPGGGTYADLISACVELIALCR